MGDFGSATEAMRIIDLFALQVFAKNFDRCNFRVLQHNPPTADIGTPTAQVRFVPKAEAMPAREYQRRRKTAIVRSIKKRLS